MSGDKVMVYDADSGEPREVSRAEAAAGVALYASRFEPGSATRAAWDEKAVRLAEGKESA
jgi:hypothetical protein